jgi:response regulator NasT
MPSLRILIADDDPIIRLDLKQMLESMGYEVVGEAGDGQHALDLARELKPEVCVLDVKMPQMDGIDAATFITAEGISATVLLTAYSDTELVKRAADAGVLAYLVKPFKPSDLPPAIEVARKCHDRFLQVNKELADAQERLESRKLLDRAKGILMETEGVTEAEAYRRIQLQSMNSRKSMKEVAEAVILAKSL